MNQVRSLWRASTGAAARDADGAGYAATAFAVALPVFLAYVWHFDFLVDDSMISFRYARNLAAGEGLRYNVGSLPPVEGYTNFLWVAWLALLHELGLEITEWSRISSLVCGAVLLFVVTRFAARRAPFQVTLVVALFTATLPPLVVWTTGGLAAVPMATFLFLGFDRLMCDAGEPHALQAGLCLLAVALLRADGVVFGGALLGVLAALSWWTDRKGLRRAVLVAAAVLAAGVALHVAWRWSYYGDWLPNTARVRAGLSSMRLERGSNYVASQLFALPSIALLLALTAVARSPLRRKVGLPSAAVVVSVLAYCVFVGGDWMPMGRFLVVAMPFVALLLLSVLSGLTAGGTARRVAFGVVTLVCIGSSLATSAGIALVPGSWMERFHYQWNTAQAFTERDSWMKEKRSTENWTRIGRLYGRYTRRGDSMAHSVIGAIGWFSDLHIYDTYGLVTPEVIRRDAPPLHKSAGHDRVVPLDYFFADDRPIEKRPNILGAVFAPASVKGDLDQMGFAEHRLRERMRAECHRLERGERIPNDNWPGVRDSLEAGLDFCLIRLDWVRPAPDALPGPG